MVNAKGKNRILVAAVVAPFIIFPSLFIFLQWRKAGDSLDRNGITIQTENTYAGSELVLSPDALHSLKLRAEAGDGVSAYRLYLHYAIGVHEQRQAQYWLDYSASLGYEVATRAQQTMKELDTGG